VNREAKSGEGSKVVTEDEENTTIAALLLDEEDDGASEGSQDGSDRRRRRKTGVEDGVVTPVPAEPLVGRTKRRARGRFCEDEFAVQIKKMCAVSSGERPTREAKRRRGRDDDPVPKCRKLPEQQAIAEEASTDEEDASRKKPDEPPPPPPPPKPEHAKPRFGHLGLLPPEVTLAILAQLNGAELGRLEATCRAARGSPGVVEFAVRHVKRHQYAVHDLPLLKRETYPFLVNRWEWTRSSKSVDTRTDEVAAALQSLDIFAAVPAAPPPSPVRDDDHAP